MKENGEVTTSFPPPHIENSDGRLWQLFSPGAGLQHVAFVWQQTQIA